ncbi:MAG TPA: MAPEG family protein [Paracoccaceae bacterium]|nr:MAPEG family protein [Paracoccaceae bacterium]
MLTIAPLYAGLIALVFLWLSARVIRRRLEAHVSVGDADDRDLKKRMRVQANCAEYAPLALILLAMAEMQGAPGWVVHLLGAMLLAGRLAHGIGMGRTPQIPLLRTVGVVLTFTMMAATALANIGHALF